MSNTMRTVFRATSDLTRSAVKKLLLLVLFVAVIASIATTSVVILATRIAK